MLSSYMLLYSYDFTMLRCHFIYVVMLLCHVIHHDVMLFIMMSCCHVIHFVRLFMLLCYYGVT